MSESASSGRGIAIAVRRSLLAGSVSSKSGKYRDWRAKESDGCSCSCSEERRETGVGSVSVVASGDGEDGSAVCMACRSTEPRGGEENDTGTTRWPGYGTDLLDSSDEVRECDTGTNFPEVVLDREGYVETFGRDEMDGEVGVTRPEIFPVD
jgi:hypothetical protein